MFCGNCGTEYIEGGSCPNCNPATKTSTNGKKVAFKKGKYISKVATPTIKSFSIVGLITSFLCVAFFVASYFSFIGRDLFNIPVLEYLSMFADDIDTDDFDDLKHELNNSSEDIDKIIEDIDCTEEEKERLLTLKKEIQDLDSEDMTLKNMNSIIVEFQDIVDEEKIAEIDELKHEANQINQAVESIELFQKIITTLHLIFIIAISLVAAFTIFGGFFKVNALVIVGLILSSILFFFLFDMLFLIIVVLLHILLIVANGIVNSSYAKYKKSLR